MDIEPFDVVLQLLSIWCRTDFYCLHQSATDITGWSFSKMLKTLTTEPLPTHRNRKGYRAETDDAVQNEDGVRKEEEEMAARGTEIDVGRNEGLTMDETKMRPQ